MEAFSTHFSWSTAWETDVPIGVIPVGLSSSTRVDILFACHNSGLSKTSISQQSPFLLCPYAIKPIFVFSWYVWVTFLTTFLAVVILTSSQSTPAIDHDTSKIIISSLDDDIVSCSSRSQLP